MHTCFYIQQYREVTGYGDIDTDPRHFRVSLLGGFAGMPQDLKTYNYKPELEQKFCDNLFTNQSGESKKQSSNSCICFLCKQYQKKTFTYHCLLLILIFLWGCMEEETEETLI